MLKTCNYIRMEVQNYASEFEILHFCAFDQRDIIHFSCTIILSIYSQIFNTIILFIDVDDVLKEGTLDSLYIRYETK